MPLFSEEDRARMEDISWDLEEIIDEACAFVDYVSAIGGMSRCGGNVRVAERARSYPSFCIRPSVLTTA